MELFFRGVTASILSASLLAACVTAPRPSAHASIPLPDRLAEGAAVSDAAPSSQWWHLYREPALNALVEEALANNRDLRAGAARLQQAQASLAEAAGQWWPQTGLTADAGYGSTLQDQIAAASAGGEKIRTGQRLELGGAVAWELDLYGRIRSAVQAARANALAAAALEDAVRVEVVADVTATWLKACSDAHRAEVARQGLALAQRRRDLAQQLQSAGAGVPVDVIRADALVAQVSGEIPLLDAGRHNALVALAALTGHPPGDIPPAAAACSSLPSIDAVLPIGNGTALLRRRPDVRSAEQKLAASTARIGIAVADLYPRISFNASAAQSSPTIGGLGSRSNLVWFAGPLLSFSFPNVSAARARVRQARADEAAAVATFDATVLRALQEVNQAAGNYAAALSRQGELRSAAQQAARADQIAGIERAAGETSALALLDAQRTDLEAQAAMAGADAAVAAAQVLLFKALGGGWEETRPPSCCRPAHTPAPATP